MDEQQLQKIETVCESVTPAPWYIVGPPWRASYYDKQLDAYYPLGTYVVAGHPDPHVGKSVIDSIGIDEWDADEPWPDYSQSDADLLFCARARTWVPELISEVRRLRAALIDISASCDCMTPGCNVDNPLCDVMTARAALLAPAEEG